MRVGAAGIPEGPEPAQLTDRVRVDVTLSIISGTLDQTCKGTGHLIQSGGGIGPLKPQQPYSHGMQVLIPARKGQIR